MVRHGAVGGVRWQVPLALLVTMFVNYLDRNNVSIALPRIAETFNWTDKQIGSNGDVLLAAFFLSYGLANMLLSPLAERFGPKRSVVLALVAFSAFTLLAWPLGGSFVTLVVLRLLLGLGEGVHVPMNSAITSAWFPPHERSRANSLWGVGVLLATALAPLIVVPVVDAVGWRAGFAILGALGLLVSVPLVLRFVHDAPSYERGVSDTELSYIRLRRVAEPATVASSAYTHNPAFWLYTLGGVLNAFCAFGFLGWLPTYLNRAKGVNFESLGWPLFVVFAAGVVGVLFFATLGDRLGRRVLLTAGGFAVAAVCAFLAISSSGVAPLVALFAAAVFAQSAFTAQEYATVQTIIGGGKVGTGTGLYNGLTIIFGGVGGSLIPGTILSSTGSYDAALTSIAVGALLATLVMGVVATRVKS